ncbi:amidophosphoribosyltransferase [Carboxydothermus pertinax]|uniref:Amidophosphoribosyltransferase n=1 Tax=Carboxydothermus pertinax TaxID=870242 RepID=A0A1L8CYF0_9THEO|nr:amidophosphoribosyltransferase [Carboxydothermus pertinax]GAV23945.1 amidophosphoribosyltransferase [Carboxydothermus pertinax]
MGAEIREECGVFGIYAPGYDVARLTYWGLFALQHRGQESAGIAVGDGKDIKLHKGMGLVAEVFSEEKLNELKGFVASGHVRYSTTGASVPINAQPLVFHYKLGKIALGHNGNLANVLELKKNLLSRGAIFQTTTDSEVILNVIAQYAQTDLVEGILKAMVDLKGAYSLVIMTENQLIGVRDPWGFRPLVLGRFKNGYVLASESAALDTIGAEFIRDVEPGEIIVIDEKGLKNYKFLQGMRHSFCIFEFIYFARPDSIINGYHVNTVRRKMGQVLAKEYPVKADLVVPVPDSGTAAARGYAEASGIPLEEGLMKNRYAGRTFIRPSQREREIGVKLKLNPIREVLKGKKIVVIDDSIVRGTTSKQIIELLRDAGAKEIHLLLSSPPFIRSCYYGIDISREDELIAAKYTLEEIKNYIGADGLYYLSLEGLLGIFKEREFCLACFTGDYPVPIN